MSFASFKAEEKTTNQKYEDTKHIVYFDRQYQHKLAEAKKYILEEVYIEDGVEIVHRDSDELFNVVHDYHNITIETPLIFSLKKYYDNKVYELHKIEVEMKTESKIVPNYTTLKNEVEYVYHLINWFQDETKKFFHHFMYIHEQELIDQKMIINDTTACVIKELMYNDLKMYITQQRA